MDQPNPYIKVRTLRKPIPPDKPWLVTLLPRWQNNSKEYLGILAFAFELLGGKYIKVEWGVAGWVIDALIEVLEYKLGLTKMERCHAICTYRDGSKTTWMQIVVLYFILIGEYGIWWEDELLPDVKYIRYRGKTFDEAEKKTDTVKTWLEDEDITNIFGFKRPTQREVKLKGLRDNVKILMTADGIILQPLGLNQPARGANIRGQRPDLDIADDVENKENTKTPEARKYNWDEVMAEQFGGLADDGLFIMIFNYVHVGGVGPTVVKLSKQKQTNWHVMVRTLSYFVRTENPDGTIEEKEVSDWPQRFPMSYVRKLEAFYSLKPDDYKIFRREYYNEILSDEDYLLLFYAGIYEKRDGHNWLLVEQPDGTQKRVNCYITVSADPAISEEKKTSDGVVAVTFFGSNGKRYVHDLSVRKFDIRDRYYEEDKKPAVLALTPEELANVRKRGMVEEIVRYIIRYNADNFVIENAGQQLAWYNDVVALLRQLHIHISGTPYHPSDEKVYKLKTGLMNQFAGGTYYINVNLPHRNRLIQGVQTFPQELDIFDALYNAEKLHRKPKPLDFSLSKGVFSTEPAQAEKNNLPDALQNPQKYIGEIETYMLMP